MAFPPYGGLFLKMIGFVLRVYSYLFHAILCLLLLALATVTLAGGQHNLHLGMLPWTGADLTYWLIGLSLVGLAATLLAVFGRLRFLFPIWCVFVLIMLIRGYFLSTYGFGGPDEFRMVMWLVVGALLAFLGSLTLLRRRA